MKRLIDEEQAFRVLSDYYKHRLYEQDIALIDALSRVPTAETDMSEYSDRLWKIAYERGKTESVKRGKWIETDEWDEFSGRLYKCSNCKTFVIGDIDNYCPYCGADMRGEE